MRGITRIVFHIFTQNPAINKAETRFLLYNIFYARIACVRHLPADIKILHLLSGFLQKECTSV